MSLLHGRSLVAEGMTMPGTATAIDTLHRYWSAHAQMPWCRVKTGWDRSLPYSRSMVTHLQPLSYPGVIIFNYLSDPAVWQAQSAAD